jgi:hypothetical protein
MIRLIGLYRDPSPARMAELVEVLRRNLADQRLAEVHVFLEDHLQPGTIPELSNHKVRLIPHGRRLTFRDLFDYGNRQLAGRPVIIANNDIYFDRTLGCLDGYELRGKLLCLSRWEVQADGSTQLFDSCSSQDAWIFQPPLPPFAADWYLGLPGCENRLAYEAQEAGLVLENPARSVRALHLHLSQVRHYSERQRLAGNGRVIQPDWLSGPSLRPVIACMGRLDDLRATFDRWIEQPGTFPVLVDYACPDGSGAWARACNPSATIVHVPDRHWFNGAEARNVGAAATPPDSVLCFLDPDVTVAAGFAEAILGNIDDGCFMVPDGANGGLGSVLICGRAAFDRAGGYDANYHGLLAAAADLRAVLQRAGFVERTFPASLLNRLSRPSEARAHFPPWPDAELSAAIDAAYRDLKDTIAAEVRDPISASTLREIRRAITHRRLAERGLLRDAPCAAIIFRETMGYSVAKLQPGASSHNNDQRPFDEIPAPLAGLAFTQVVASRLSPVHVTFRDPGKLYVLVGTDWDGCHKATAFLRERGHREPLPCVRTRRGTGFEVWSVVGEVGETLEFPTQVMLVARELVAVTAPRAARSNTARRRSASAPP